MKLTFCPVWHEDLTGGQLYQLEQLFNAEYRPTRARGTLTRPTATLRRTARHGSGGREGVGQHGAPTTDRRGWARTCWLRAPAECWSPLASRPGPWCATAR
ncbi:hypothetical protein QJS66_16145 [Kocuria rhizophila]|nr:hypothetical protein QJS66_16145 [Kocuria rhizophila]